VASPDVMLGEFERVVRPIAGSSVLSPPHPPRRRQQSEVDADERA